MKVNGIKYLNSNLYDKIIIRRLEEGIKIDIKGKSKINTIKTSTIFYDEIKNLSDKEKISEIVEYFLRNNKIQHLEDRKKLTHYNGKFTVIGGPRELLMQIKKEDIDNNILKLLKEKYIKDREEFLIKHNDIELICIGESFYKSSYQMIENDFYREVPYININLKQCRGKLEDFEYDFFMKFIEEKINNSEKIICVSPKEKAIIELRAGEVYLKCDECTICLSHELYLRIQHLIYNHNLLFEETKKLQLTFEGYNS